MAKGNELESRTVLEFQAHASLPPRGDDVCCGWDPQ